jgi:hypothetical protein
MTTLRLSLVAAIAAVAVCSAGAPAQAQSSPAAAATVSTGVPVYQGTAFILKVNAACTNNDVNVGDYLTMLYRPFAESGNTSYGGGIGFSNERAAVSYVLAAGQNLTPANEVQSSVDINGESSKVGPFCSGGGSTCGSGPGGSFNLTISNPGTAAAPANWVTITGTVNNLWNYSSSCNVTIRAALALRP